MAESGDLTPTPWRVVLFTVFPEGLVYQTDCRGRAGVIPSPASRDLGPPLTKGKYDEIPRSSK